MPNRIHVERGVQFKPELFKKADRTQWFTEVGKELEKRRLTLTLATGLTVRNADDLIKVMKRYESDKSGLKTALNLPAGTTLENYVGDLVQAIDDTVKTTSSVKDKLIDFQPASPLGKLLGLDTSSRYASTTTVFGKTKADAVTPAGEIELARTGAAPDPLEGQLYMDSKTFANVPPYQWKRDGVELEQVNGVTKVSDDKLIKALRATNGAGRTAYQRLRKPELSEAYTIGYSGVGLDDMRWDTDAHQQREKNKFVSLTVETGRYEPSRPGDPREVTLGTDKMDDVYYDTKDFALMDADITVRGRARWDTDTEIRRILVQVKSNTVIDEFGLKRNGKVDVRNDGASPEEVAALDHDVRTGMSSWNTNPEPFMPMKGVYDQLAAANKLPDIGEHQGVLQLEPKVHIRSVRSRYHLNETSLSSMQEFYKATTGKLQAMLALATTAQATATGADKKRVDDLVKSGTALEDGSALLAAVSQQLEALDPAMTVDAASVKALMPDPDGVTWNRPKSDALTIEKKRVVADALDGLYHQFAEQLDGARRVITGSQDRTYENVPKLYQAFARSVDAALITKNTFDPFLTRLDASLAKPEAELTADLAAFNAFGAAQKTAGNRDFREWKDLSVDGFKALRPQVLNEVVRVNQRQLEAGGSMAKGLWYDEARAFYVPKATRNTGNFIIDTTDMSEYVKHDDWESIPADQRTPANLLPVDKVFHVSLVNETQIELGEEKEYLARLEELSKQLSSDRASLLMKYFDSAHTPGIDAAQPASYQTALEALLDGPAADRDAAVTALNAFMKAQGSALEPVTAKDLEWLAKPGFAFTAEQRTAAVRTTPDLERMMAGAKFVFEQIIDVQKSVVASKEERVKKTLKDAGVDDMEWKQTEDSKGIGALKLVRAAQKPVA